MKKYTSLLAIIILSTQIGFAQSFDILVFSKTAAFRHANAINAGNIMFSNVARANGWTIDFTENSADFTKENLSKYDAIIWNNVSGNVLKATEKEAFKSYINDGGGYVGIHNAANAETNWPWYVDLLGGATFLNHAAGSHQIQSVSIDTENTTDSITSHFESSFTRTDEWYNFTSNPRPYVDLLLSIDESTLEGPNMGGDHPITWKHEYDGGRAFYTGFGHTVESFSEPDVIIMLTEAINWVASKNSIILDEFNGSTEPGSWVIQAPYNAYGGTFPFTATKDEIEITGVLNGPNQHLVRKGVTIDASLPYTVETKFKILNYGGIRSFAVNFLQANQPASQRVNAWSLNLDLAGPVIKYMGFVNGSFSSIGIRKAPWAVQNQEYIYKIEVNRRLNGEFSPKWVTATISKPDGTLMDTFEVDYSKFRWQPNLNEPVKFGLNSHYASWVASDLKIFYSDKVPSTNEDPQQDPQEPQDEPNLIAYWPFDGNADDVSGNHNHGAEYNNPFYPAAYLNNGLETNEAYVTADSDSFDGSKFTLMAWIKPDNVSGSYRVIFEKDKFKSDWYGLYQIGNKIHVRWSLSGTTTATPVALETDVFSHVAATFDGSTAKIYINGVLKHSTLGTPSKPSVTKGQLRIGVDGVGREAFQGIIDEAKIFGTALHQSKIQFEMESSSQDEGNIPDPVSPPSKTPVTGVAVSPDSITLNTGDTSTLTATISPGNASNKNVIWTSDNPLIARVNTSGVLTAVAGGTTNIKVTTVDGGFVDSTSISVSATTPSIPSEEPNLIAYWPFDGNADDVSGNHNHGAEYNNPFYPAAYLNNGLETNKAYVAVDSDSFDGSKFTLMAWIKPDNVSGSYRVIFEKDKFKSDWYGLYQIGNKIHVRWSLSGTTTATPVSLETDVFSHVAATFDGSTAKIYINGVLKHSTLGTPSKPSVTKGQLRIGIDGVGREAFQGIIDEAKIFGTALHQSKIQFEMDSSSQDEGNIPDPVSPPSEVPVTGVAVSPDSITLNTGDTSTLTATISPGNASNTNVIWTSDNPLIARVNTSGVLTAVAGGTTNIKVTTVDGSFVDSTSISVSANEPITPSVDPKLSFDSISYQLASLKILSWDKINNGATRKTADTHLAQAKYYLRIGIANFNNNRKASGTHYINISNSLIKKFISSVESNKISKIVSLPLINEANSIISNINFLIDGE